MSSRRSIRGDHGVGLSWLTLILVERTGDDLGEQLQRVLEPVVDDHVRELRLGRELLRGDAQPALDLLWIVGSPPDQPCAQRVERGRRDEHLDRLGHRGANLAGTLDLDLQHDGHAGVDARVGLVAQRPVAAPRVGGVFDEVAPPDSPVELLGREKW